MDNQPILVAVGQCKVDWDGTDQPTAPSPQALMIHAARNAIADTRVVNLSQNIDWIAVVRLFADSLPTAYQPFGKVQNYPQLLAQELNISDYTAIYSVAGGEQPQSLVNELAERLYKGQSKMGLIAGSEANGALKLALKNQIQLDWTTDQLEHIPQEGHYIDRGAQIDFISSYEIANGMGMPPQTYGLMEQALRARLGLSPDAYRQWISEILSSFSQVAANNPYSQFPIARSAKFLATPSGDNYPICDPYLKWHIAQDAVNQGAAIIMTTVALARQLAIPEPQWIYLQGHAKARDKVVSQRADISRSLPLELTINAALEDSNLSAGQLTQIDIYSCFPIVVAVAAEILGVDPLKTDLTVTGGLPFFGGPGNNYSTHAIATMVQRLRVDTVGYGLIVANGGFMSKEAVGIYSKQAPSSWQPFNNDRLQSAINNQTTPKLLAKNCTAIVEAYGIRHARNSVDHVYMVANNAEGRIMAKVASDQQTTLAALAGSDELIGRTVTIAHDNGENIIVAAALKPA